jgi:hypothetical protein
MKSMCSLKAHSPGTGGVAQDVEHLPYKHEIQNSNHRTSNKYTQSKWLNKKYRRYERLNNSETFQ